MTESSRHRREVPQTQPGKGFILFAEVGKTHEMFQIPKQKFSSASDGADDGTGHNSRQNGRNRSKSKRIRQGSKGHWQKARIRRIVFREINHFLFSSS